MLDLSLDFISYPSMSNTRSVIPHVSLHKRKGAQTRRHVKCTTEVLGEHKAHPISSVIHHGTALLYNAQAQWGFKRPLMAILHTHTHTDTLPQGDKILERCTKVKDSKIVDDFTFSFSFIFILKFLSSLALLLIICESEKTLVKPTGM